MTGRLLTAPEVAELLSVPESWVREHTRNGTIPHLELGRYKRYDRDQVLAWVDSLRTGGNSAVRFRRYSPAKQNGLGDAQTPRGLTPKE